MFTTRYLLALILPATLAVTALAQTTTDHSAHMAAPAAAMPPAAETASTTAYRDINSRMHQGMEIAFTGNADLDFVTGMIAHHQGAVEMAKVVLAHGEDPEIRKLAEGVIAAQEAEIAQMHDWLNRHGHPVPAAKF